MADELIRLDTTIIGMDALINKAETAAEANALFKAKDVIYSQQRYFADVQPVDRWISCKDKMPEDGQDVITLSEGRILNHAVYDAEKAVFRYKILIINPTHWIPLPPLPEAIRHDETCTVVK